MVKASCFGLFPFVFSENISTVMIKQFLALKSCQSYCMTYQNVSFVCLTRFSTLRYARAIFYLHLCGIASVLSNILHLNFWDITSWLWERPSEVVKLWNKMKIKSNFEHHWVFKPLFLLFLLIDVRNSCHWMLCVLHWKSSDEIYFSI